MHRAGEPTLSAALLVTAGRSTCAVPLAHVVETMRPQPAAPLAGGPAFVTGVAVIRGVATPVVDLRRLLGADEPAAPGRFVTLRAAQGQVAVAVDAVVGVSDLGAAQLGELPPLLAGAASEVASAIGTRDAGLLVVLRAARLVPAEVWAALAATRSR